MKIISNQTLTYVLEAGRSVAPVLKSGDIVILESTSPVGTTETLRDLLAAERPDLKFPASPVTRPIFRWPIALNGCCPAASLRS